MTSGPRSDEDPVWYVAYGSNLNAARFACYLAGGRPDGAGRSYAGCRDRAPARDSAAARIPGRLRFGGVSAVWGGALAFLDADAPGEAWGRAYLVTFGQFRDVAAQEARLSAGHALALAPDVRRWPDALPGAYETVLEVGELGGHPMLTFTSLRPGPPAAPGAAYLRTILTGLTETYGAAAPEHARYLLSAPGVSPSWTERALRELARPDSR